MTPDRRPIPEPGAGGGGRQPVPLGEQHCEGASPDNSDGSTNLTLTLYILDKDETARDHFVFATRVKKDDTTSEIAQRLLVRFMDRLTQKYGISTLDQPGDLNNSDL